jgi:hypothetical protein
MQSFPATMLTLVGLFAAASVIRPRSPSAPATGKTAKAAQPDAPLLAPALFDEDGGTPSGGYALERCAREVRRRWRRAKR